eukprot:3225209-Rhodomonas_salina.1
MEEGQTSAWLQKEPATEDFFSKLLSAHFLVDQSGLSHVLVLQWQLPYNNKGMPDPVLLPAGDVQTMTLSRTLPRLSRPSRLLQDNHLWVLGGTASLVHPFFPLLCLARISLRVFFFPRMLTLKSKLKLSPRPAHIPPACQDRPWKCLYSSNRQHPPLFPTHSLWFNASL